MDGENGRSTVQSLLESIKTANVLESRISLISQLRDAHQSDASDLALIIQSLPTLWDDSTCSGTSQLILNKTVLHVASRYLELDTASCLSHFLILGTKASMWCGKHLQMMIMPSEESQEEQSSLFCQLIGDSSTFFSATTSALTRSPLLGEKVVMLIVENFIYGQLNITKASILEIKKNHPYSSEVIRVAQVVLDASIKLCRAYYQAIKWHSDVVKTDGDKGLADGEGVDLATHIISMITCTVEHLYELGILAAASGGSLVSILNVSWKGVVSLLQLGKGVLADKIDTRDIVLTLISLATESLRCSAETWFSKLKDTLVLSEAKRTFLPIKFYLINAVRISSEYTHQTLSISMGITKSVLMISCFGISFSKETHLRAASEALTELLEPHSFLLLHALLNSTDVKHESQFQILDWLFPEEGSDTFVLPNEFVDTHTNITTSIDGISAVDHDGMPRAGTLVLGRVILFLNILKNSPLLKEELLLGISRKLGYLFSCLMNEDVYSSILILHIPVLCGSGATSSGVAWQPILPFMLHALKTFMIVAASSSLVWMEVESFLFQNLFHCHFLCVEILTEVWCFLMRHAEPEMINGFLDGLASLLKAIASSEPTLTPFCPLRKMAKSICVMLSYAKQPVVDQFYSSILSDNGSYCLSIMNIALLLEGFPLDSLSDNLKKLSVRRIITEFHDFIENNGRQPELCSGPLESRSSSIIGLPILFLSAALRSRQFKSCNAIDEKSISCVLKFTVFLIHGYKSAKDSLHGPYRILLGATLSIISNAKHLYASEEMREVILELQTLFASETVTSDAMLLYQCKPALASFMAGLCHMEIEESDKSKICSAVQALYHMLLRERHWALIHLALMALEYFAERTSCSQLWRFLPHDAALSFDTNTGNEANEERFMSEFKAFLRKEVSLSVTSTPCSDDQQLGLLLKEGIDLKEKVLVNVLTALSPEVARNQIMDTHHGEKKRTNAKKRKLPGGIDEGMTLLQSGLKVLSDGLAHTDSMELKAEFSHHLSCLEDVISHLLGLSGGEL